MVQWLRLCLSNAGFPSEDTTAAVNSTTSRQEALQFARLTPQTEATAGTAATTAPHRMKSLLLHPEYQDKVQDGCFYWQSRGQVPTTLVTTKMKQNVDGEKSEEVVEGQIIKDLFLNILF